MAENITIVIRAQAAQAVKEFDRVSRDLTATADRMRSVGTSLTLGLSLPLGAAGLAAARFGSQFDETITQVETLVGVAADRVAQFRAAILELGPEVGRGPRELARALFVVTSAGERGANAMEIVEQAAKASAIGLGDTATVARAVTAAMQAFRSQGLTAAQATAILTETVREGNLEAASLAGSLGRVLGIASQVGVTFAEVGAFVATFTRLGVQADEAVTSLRSILTAMLKPTAGSAAALAKVGLSIEILRDQITERGLTAALIDLVQRFRGNEEAIAQVIPNIRALSGVLGTAGAQADQFGQIARSITGDVAGFERAFQRVKETPAQTFREFRAQAETVAVTLGDAVAPALSQILRDFAPVVGVAADAARAFAGVNETLQEVIVTLGIFVVGLGPATLAISGLVRAFALLQGALAALRTAGLLTAAALGPTSVLVVGLGLVAAALIAVRRHSVRAAEAIRDLRRAAIENVDVVTKLAEVERLLAENQAKAARLSRAAQAARGTSLEANFARQLGEALAEGGRLRALREQLIAQAEEAATIEGLVVSATRATTAAMAAQTAKVGPLVDAYGELQEKLDGLQADLLIADVTLASLDPQTERWTELQGEIADTRTEIQELTGAMDELNRRIGTRVAEFMANLPAITGPAIPPQLRAPSGVRVPAIGGGVTTDFAAIGRRRSEENEAASFGLTVPQLRQLHEVATAAGTSVEDLAHSFGLVASEADQWRGVTIAGLGSVVEAAISGFDQIEVVAIRTFTQIAQTLAQEGGPLAGIFGAGLGVPIFGALGGVLAAAFARRPERTPVEIDRFGPTALAQQRDVFEERPQHVTIQLLDAQGNVIRTMKQIKRRESLDAVTRIPGP